MKRPSRHRVPVRAQVRVIGVIARHAIRETLRGRLPVAWIGMLAVLAAAGFFLDALSLVEHETVVLSVLAPLARLAAVLITATFVIAGVSREFTDRNIDMMFAAPVPRHAWVLGRFAGYTLLAAGTALMAGLPLLLQSPVLALLTWTLSLLAELVMVAGIALLITISLVRVPIAMLAFGALYGCARVIGVIQMLDRANVDEGQSPFSVGGMLIDGLAALLPRLDLLTRTDWLLDGFTGSIVSLLTPALGQSLLYSAIVLLAATIDVGNRRA
ncbi:MAG: ABC transporter permease [Burkholderiaceae bacterium]